VTTYTVNMSNLQQIAEEMGTIANQIQNALDEVESTISQSLAEWTSAARDAYNQAQAQWNADCAQMAVQATNAMNSLNDINNTYQSAESQGVSMWS
jgi:WXG100 family type VII secretion target